MDMKPKELTQRWTTPRATEAQRLIQHILIDKSNELGHRADLRRFAKTQNYRDKLDRKKPEDLVQQVREVVSDLWGETDPSGRLDLRGITLNGSVWNLNLAGMDFSYGRSEAPHRDPFLVFKRCCLDRSSLCSFRSELGIEACSAVGCSFSRANLRRNNFQNSNITGACFEGAVLTGTHFEKNDLCGCSFRNANLRNAFFAYVLLNDADFTGAKCAGAFLQDAKGTRELLDEIETEPG